MRSNQTLYITAVILAGGRGRRMGGQDKGLVEYRGIPLIEHVISRIQPQVDELIISANRHLERYAQWGYPVISDVHAGFQGPLAGIASAWQHAHTDHLLVVPCDMPLLPDNLALRLQQAMQQQQRPLAVAHDGQRLQPLVMLMSTRLQEDMRDFLASGQRRMHDWCARHKPAIADCSDVASGFYNMNCLEDLLE